MSKENTEYKYYFNPDNGMVTKENPATGETWTYLSFKRKGKANFKASNGITVDKLVAAGNSVRVKHLRYALYRGLNEKLINKKDYDFELRRIVVPSTFRKDVMYELLPKGGFTHVVIKHPSGKYICVSSECSEQDPFCYSMGVATALERLSRLDMELLGV